MFLKNFLKKNKSDLDYFFDRAKRPYCLGTLICPEKSDLEVPAGKRSQFISEFFQKVQLVFVNPDFVKLFGAKTEDFDQLRFSQLITRSTGLWKAASDFISTGYARGVLYSQRMDNAQPLFLQYTLTAIQTKKGIPVDVFATFRDITEEEKREEALEKKHHLINFFFDEALDGFLVAQLPEREGIVWPPENSEMKPDIVRYLAENMRVSRANRAVLQQYRAQWEDLLGKRVYDLFPYEDQTEENIFHYFTRLLDNEGHSGQVVRKRFDDQLVNFEAEHRILRNENNQVIGIVGTQRDITDRLKMETQLQEAQQAASAANYAKDEYLAHISHEVRNPLNSIVGLSDLLMLSPVTEQQLGLINDLRGTTDYLLHLVNNLLDFSKLEAHKMTLEDVDFNLRSLIQSAFDQAVFLGLISKKSTLSIFEDIPDILRKDPVRLKQVLITMLSDAGKRHTDHVIHLKVAISKTEKESVWLSFVTATHQKPANLTLASNNIIEASYRLSNIELSVCAKLVELMGGQVYSCHCCGGASDAWAFTLPFYPPETLSDPALLQDTTEELSLDRIGLVLIVDDSEINQRVISKMLVSKNIKIAVASNGKEALSFYQRLEAPGLILMDIEMPEINGIEATRLIREYEQVNGKQPVPIIAMTGHNSQEERDRCLSVGMNEVLTKPVTLRVLHQTIERILQGINQS